MAKNSRIVRIDSDSYDLIKELCQKNGMHISYLLSKTVKKGLKELERGIPNV